MRHRGRSKKQHSEAGVVSVFRRALKLRGRSRKKRAHHSASKTAPWRVVPVAAVLGLLGLWAMLPFGGETPWVAESILLGTLAAALVLHGLQPASRRNGHRDDAGAQGSTDRGWVIALILMGIWAAFQWMPLPTAVVHGLQPGWKTLLDGLPVMPERIPLSVDRSVSIPAFSLWVALCVLAAVTVKHFRDRHAARLLAHVIAALGMLQAFAALIIPGLSESWWSAFSSARLMGTFSNPNALGGFMALTIPVTLGLLLTLQSRLMDIIGSRWKRLFTLTSRHHGLLIEWVVVFLSLLAQMVTLIGSGSRGAVLATLAPVAILFGGYFITARMTRQSTIQLAALLLIAILAVTTGGGLYLLMQRFEADMMLERGLPGRLIIWGAVLRMLMNFPLGVGAGGLPLILPGYQSGITGGVRIDYAAHNEYLHWAAEFGIPGLILLCVVLAGLFRRGVRTVTIPGVRGSAWIWRGAALGVLATLLHAMVDFNLVVYPGIRTLFFIVCGLMLSVPRQRPEESRGEDGSGQDRASASDMEPASARRDGPRRSGMTVLLVCLTIGLGIPAYFRMTTAWQVEGARRALDLPPLKAFWIPAPWVAPDRALSVISEASEKYPNAGWLRYWRAVGILTQFETQFERERQAAIDELRAEWGAMDRAGLRRIEGMVDMAMQYERRLALTESLAQVEHAIDLAPWSPDMRNLAANIRARLAVLEGATVEGSKHRRAAMRWMDGAVRLAPEDTIVLVDACRALALLLAEAMDADDAQMVTEARKKLDLWGRRAVDLDPGTTAEVLAAWQMAGILDDQLVDMENLPIPVLRGVYDYFAESGQAGQAMRVLERLEYAYGASPDDVRHLRFIERERYRWLLWQADASAYRAALEHRRELWRNRQQQWVADENLGGLSDTARRLRLRAAENRIGLTVEHLLTLAQLEWDRRATDAAHAIMVRTLVLGAGLPGTDPSDLELIRAWRQQIATRDDHYAVLWLDARLAQMDGNPRLAAQRYVRLLTHSRLPLRFRHRIRLEAASAWASAGDMPAAVSQIEAALREGADDPDVLQAWIDAGFGDVAFRASDGRHTMAVDRLRVLNPSFELGTRFMGERFELTGLTFEPYGTLRRTGVRMKLHWRFFDRIPSDLRVICLFRGHDGYVFFRRNAAFGELLTDSFSAGEPKVGHFLVMEILLPPLAMAGDRLEISLHSGPRRLSSDEGLPRLVIQDWTRLLD